MNIFLALILPIFMFTSSYATAHPYLPLDEKVTLIHDYNFHVDTDKKEFKQEEVKGTLKVTADKWEEKAGKKYLRFITSYNEIPFMKNDTYMYRREENGNIYLASEINGKISESIELPANTEVGSEWKYSDGVDSKREITAKIKITLPSGEILTDCIEVNRQVIKNESLKSAVDKNTYCRGLGKVHSLFFQPSPVGDYKTETILRDSKTAPNPPLK